MTIKDILLNGGCIKFPYKQKEKEWVGTASIAAFSGGFGLKPKILVEIPTIDLVVGGRKEFDFKDIDNAITTFESIVFRKENLCYKMHEVMVELYDNGEIELDLDEPKILKKVRKLQKEKQNGN